MKDFIKQLDAKTIATLVTSVGGILLAGGLIYLLIRTTGSSEKIITNDLGHINDSINRQTAVQEKTNDVLRDAATAIEGTTKVLEIIERRIK